MTGSQSRRHPAVKRDPQPERPVSTAGRPPNLRECALAGDFHHRRRRVRRSAARTARGREWAGDQGPESTGRWDSFLPMPKHPLPSGPGEASADRPAAEGARIDRVAAREILDSRGHPTVEAEVWLRGGACGRAAVPSGASTGRHEAVERRDGDPDRYRGRGVLGAVRSIEQRIGPELRGRDARDQAAVDGLMIELDGTPDRSGLGANAILAVSLANARAAAARQPLYRALGGGIGAVLPVPHFNVLNGGAHADNALQVQEFMVVPLGFSRFSEALRAGVSVYHELRAVLSRRGHSTAVGDEGGFAPALSDAGAALELLVEAIEAAGFQPGEDMGLALDVAASEFGNDHGYRYPADSAPRPAEAMIEIYAGWRERFPALVSIEDGLAEDDWDGWTALTRALGERIQLVGDDLFVTREERLERGVRQGAANAILIKPNQVGTLTETIRVVRRARRAGFGVMLSHRSGETADTAISHLAVATGAGQIKAGAPCRGERVAKYNELLRIEEDLGDAGRLARRPAAR